MFRITEIYEDKEKAKLRLEGKIAEPCVPDLEDLICITEMRKTKKLFWISQV